MKISGKLIDIHHRIIYPAMLNFNNKVITKITKEAAGSEKYIIPGLIDSHIHVESSMTTPGSFASAAVSHGTIGVVSDPHEIANVLGIKGIKFMIADSEKVPFKFWFGAPSCVPATQFESSGAVLGQREIERLLKMKNIKYLAEMMNYPGVISNDQIVMGKINVAKRVGKPIDGHAPGLSGEMLKKYISAGISTDHECSTMGEAKEKISLGMKILIREGSAARNLNSLKELFITNPEMLMLCSDDLHPEMILKRHINKMVAQLVSEGYDLFDVIRSCTINPVVHYNLEAGLLRPGEPADFIIVDDPRKMNVSETWINGEKVYDCGSVLFNYPKADPVNRFNCSPINQEEIKIARKGNKIRVIEAFDGELLTKEILIDTVSGEYVETDPDSDFLKIVVKDRYIDSPPATGFIKGFRLRYGAFASSIAHDSHNIICVGTNDNDIIKAVNEIVKLKGGLAISSGGRISSLQLNIAGIISDKSVDKVAADYELLSNIIKSMGCTLSAPFMTLSFMALLVIPELKLSDRGLFDGKKFCHVPLFVE